MAKKLKIILFLFIVYLVAAGVFYFSHNWKDGNKIAYASNSPDPSVIDTFDNETKIASKENLVVSGGQVKLSAGPWTCGDSVTFSYKGSSVTYRTVSHNSKCWLDRNLGASQVATAYNDANAYGDLFQWGRLSDLHQNRNSGKTTTLSSNDVPGHSNFIYGMSSPYDWRSSQNNNLWQGVSGTNNPCPSGWRLPTSDEWNAERLSWSSNDYNGAYASPLKLTRAGNRYYSSASLSGEGSYGVYWSSTVSGANAYYLFFTSGNAYMLGNVRAYGLSVRCLKDTTTSKANGTACTSGSECRSSYCYRDADGDGYGVTSGAMVCKASASLGADCYDLNANANPSQASFFTTHRGDGSFDYNCDKTETKQNNCLTTLSNFVCGISKPSGSAGYVSSIPPCGVSGTMRSCRACSNTRCSWPQCWDASWCGGSCDYGTGAETKSYKATNQNVVQACK